MMPMQQLVDEALQANQEAEQWDFKASLDVSARAELLEVVKDIIAMANSGGGVLLVGLNDDGSPSNHDTSALLAFDPAKMTDQIARATGRQFSSFRVSAVHKGGQTVAAILVGGVPVPLVTIVAGAYQDPGNPSRQKYAFNQGVAYFRHGAKSEPGTTEDLERVIKREIEAAREGWLGNIRQVSEAPLGSRIIVLKPGQSAPVDGLPFRSSDSPDAPELRLTDDDWREHYPYDYRQLTNLLRDRYVDFKENNAYHELRHPLESDRQYCIIRHLDPGNPRTQTKRLYGEAIIGEFDKHYTRHPDD